MIKKASKYSNKGEFPSFSALAGGFLNKVGPENLGMAFLHQMATRNQHLSNFFDLPPSLLIPLYWYYTSGIRMGGYFKKSRIKAYDVDILMPSAIRITCVKFHGRLYSKTPLLRPKN